MARPVPHDHDLGCRCPRRPWDARIADAATATFGRGAFLAGAAALAGGALLPRTARAADDVVVYRAARLFDGLRMTSPGVVVTRGERIVSLTAGDAPAGATVVDLGDATLLPGLIDAHTHVAANVVVSRYLVGVGRPDENADSVAEAALLSIHNAQAMLANGFTTVRDVGGASGIDLAMRDAIRRGAVLGPRMLVAGPSLSITGGHADRNDLPPSVAVATDIEGGVAAGPYAFRERVREHVKRHVDLIKITSTGGVLSYGDVWDVPQFNPDEIAAVVDEAAKFGLHVASHAHGDRGIAQAVRGGVHTIEHGTGVGDATLGHMKQRNTALVPTLWALDSILQPGNPNRISANGLEKAGYAARTRDEGMHRARAAGVRLVYGTDAGVFPHRENNRDFALLRRFGYEPLELLRAATATAAETIGTTDRGRIAPGLLADLVAFRGDLGRDLAPLEGAPALVVLGGKRIDPAALRTTVG